MANQNLISLEQDDRIEAAARRLQMGRREFLQFCAAMATTLGLPQGDLHRTPRIQLFVKALKDDARLHGLD